MALTAGIVGLHQTLESQHYLMQLQKAGVEAANYPFCDD